MKKLMILLSLSLILFSCSKDSDLSKVDETLYVRYEGADMPVYMRGNVNSNVIVLIVHGGPGGNGLEYRTGQYSVELEEKYGIAYWDQRGQGMSHGKYKSSDLTVQAMADDMLAVVRALKSKYGSQISIFALGHSWGGTLTARYMTTGNYQHELKGWIEVDGAHDIPQLNKDAVAMFISVAKEQIALGNNVENWQSTLEWAEAIDTNNITSEQGGRLIEKALKQKVGCRKMDLFRPRMKVEIPCPR
ncbi:alpha/beta fold hydrolase [bacterium SCSIO 12741]|nr:alpha/beta fold hydrolase [bacterium SCSIO 12741]